VIAAEAETLGILFDRIKDAMRRAQIHESSVYAVGNDGFAVVGRMEQIEEDGRAKPGFERWNVEPIPRQRTEFGLSEYLRVLFSAQPGRYRVIVLIVTGRLITAGPQQPTPSEMTHILKAGVGDLSEQLRVKVLQSSGRCEALVYEFYRPSEDADPRWVDSSHLQPTDHLAGAGLWRREELLP
jgi:hypothetical protein